MSTREKLIERFRLKPKDFTWDELIRLLGYFGYDLIPGSGSRRKFINEATNHKIFLHEPHPGNILKGHHVKSVHEALEREGLI